MSKIFFYWDLLYSLSLQNPSNYCCLYPTPNVHPWCLSSIWGSPKLLSNTVCLVLLNTFLWTLPTSLISSLVHTIEYLMFPTTLTYEILSNLGLTSFSIVGYKLTESLKWVKTGSHPFCNILFVMFRKKKKETKKKDIIKIQRDMDGYLRDVL